MTQETPRNHDHSSRGSGGKEIRPESVSAEELRGIADVILGPSETVGEMQAAIDDAGARSTIWLEPGAYLLNGGLSFHDSTTVYWLNSDVTLTNTSDGVALLSNADQGQGNDDLTFILHGSTFRGDRANVADGDDQEGVRVGGGDDDIDDPSLYCNRIKVLGGRFTEFSAYGVRLYRCLKFDVNVTEADNNGDPSAGDTQGDGVYVLRCKDGRLHCENAHDNDRHGIACQGEQEGGRCINIEFTGSAESNGADGFGLFGCESMAVDAVTTDNQSEGVRAKGTGRIEAIVDGSGGRGIYTTVSDYSGSVSDTTGETSNASSMRIDATVRNTGDNGIEIFTSDSSGPSDITATVSATLKNIGGIGIHNPDYATMVVESVNADGIDRQAVYLGNRSTVDGGSVQGGEIRNYNRTANDTAAIASGPNLGDGHVVSGVSIGPAANAPTNVIHIRAGDNHVVNGNAARGGSIAVNGANSVESNNS